jgi:hypothetical protein
MILAYTDILGNRKTHRIKATITTDHSASSYGQPVIVLPDGDALDLQSWVLLGYKVVRATRKEQVQLQQILSLIGLMYGGD